MHPLRERLRRLLVKVLHVEGRVAEALRAYEDFRRLLVEQLGADLDRTRFGGHTAVDCPIRRETREWVRHAVALPRSTRPKR
jgi:hypothetical protein